MREDSRVTYSTRVPLNLWYSFNELLRSWGEVPKASSDGRDRRALELSIESLVKSNTSDCISTSD